MSAFAPDGARVNKWYLSHFEMKLLVSSYISFERREFASAGVTSMSGGCLPWSL